MSKRVIDGSLTLIELFSAISWRDQLHINR